MKWLVMLAYILHCRVESLVCIENIVSPSEVVFEKKTVSGAEVLLKICQIALYFLPSGTSTVPILTSTGPNYLLPGLPNHLPVHERPPPEIRQPHSILNSGETFCCLHQPHCRKSLLDRIKQQCNKRLKMQNSNVNRLSR